MDYTLSMLSRSLQVTSQVLSRRGSTEQSMMQESVSMLLGDFMLEGIDMPSLCKTLPAAQVTAMSKQDGGRRVYELFTRQDRVAAVDSTTGACVLMKRVLHADEWESLPVHFQNFVKADHLPVCLMVAVQQQQIEGDTCHRHYALPVFALMTVRASGRLDSEYCFSDAQLRAQAGGARALDAEAAQAMEPYLRLFLTHCYSQAEPVGAGA